LKFKLISVWSLLHAANRLPHNESLCQQPTTVQFLIFNVDLKSNILSFESVVNGHQFIQKLVIVHLRIIIDVTLFFHQVNCDCSNHTISQDSNIIQSQISVNALKYQENCAIFCIHQKFGISNIAVLIINTDAEVVLAFVQLYKLFDNGAVTNVQSKLNDNTLLNVNVSQVHIYTIHQMKASVPTSCTTSQSGIVNRSVAIIAAFKLYTQVFNTVGNQGV